MLAETAAHLKITIHGGSFLEQDGQHIYNTTPVYGPDGNLLAAYRKQHPFHCPAVPQGSGTAEIDFIEPKHGVTVLPFMKSTVFGWVAPSAGIFVFLSCLPPIVEEIVG
jgi:predicted amidohydrolase